MKPSILAALVVFAAAVGTTGAAVATASSGAASSAPRSVQQRAERATAQRTQRFVRAFERRDLRAVSSMLDADVTLVQPITFSGEQRPDARFVGKPQVLRYFRTVFRIMGRIRFTDQRVSVIAGGRASFVQAYGDFTTADGRPYHNVYLLRFNWRGGRIASGEEYANPVTFSEAFGTPLG